MRSAIGRAVSCWILFAMTAAAAEPGPIAVGTHDWPVWRGPQGNGIANPDQQPPLNWSRTENVLWKTSVPGRGHSSPTIVGDRVFVSTADEKEDLHAVLCFDRLTGRSLWRTDVHRGGLDRKGNKKTSQASSSPACDGKLVYVNFLHDGVVHTTALDLDGRRVWQTPIAPHATHQGFGSSPAIYGGLVFVTTDSRGGGAVTALDRATGTIVWQDKQRPAKANYASPVVLRAAGADQLLVSGCDLVSSFEPLTGKKRWEVAGSTTECVTTMVTDGKLVFVSGGYPKKHTQAIRADGSGTTAWENNFQVYVPSMVVHDGHVYASGDGGVAICWKSDTGEETWKSRLGGTFSSSLVLVRDRLYATNEAGSTFVFKANPQQFELLAENKLGDEVFGTPSICGGRIYHRVAEFVNGTRQEMLYCLGK